MISPLMYGRTFCENGLFAASVLGSRRSTNESDRWRQYSSSSSDSAPTEQAIPLRPLPESFELGDVVVADLPPGQLLNTYFAVQNPSDVLFNISVGARTKLAVYLRQTMAPSPADYDFVQIIHGDRLRDQGVSSQARFYRSVDENVSPQVNGVKSFLFYFKRKNVHFV